MFRIVTYPYYLKSLLSSFLSLDFKVDSEKRLDKFLEKVKNRVYDAYIISHKDERLIHREDFIDNIFTKDPLIILDEVIKRGYKPVFFKNKILKEGFFLDPEAFHLVVDVVVEYLVNRLLIDAKSLYDKGEVLKNLYLFSIEKSKKIVSKEVGDKVIPLTSIEYYIMRSLEFSPETIIFDIETCEKYIKNEELQEYLSDRLIIATKQSINELTSYCGKGILGDIIRENIRNDRINYLLIDTSLNCHIFVPVIFSTSIAVYF
ncbi:MAG: hypothetical protein ACP5GI_05050 [Sulfolobales archaeon]